MALGALYFLKWPLFPFRPTPVETALSRDLIRGRAYPELTIGYSIEPISHVQVSITQFCAWMNFPKPSFPIITAQGLMAQNALREVRR